MLGPVLVGERITLAPARPEHLPEFVRWFADLEVTRFLLVRFPFSEKQEQEWYDSVAGDRTCVHWAIFREERLIGVTGIHQIDWINRNAITGTILGVRDEWGKGFATEAVRLRTQFAFQELNLERLESQSFAENGGMHKALQRSGYREIGRRSHARFSEGSWHDIILFELLRDQWQAAAG